MGLAEDADDSNTLTLELHKLGYDSKFGKINVVACFDANGEGCFEFAEIKVTNALYEAAQTVVLNYDEQYIHVPFSTNGIENINEFACIHHGKSVLALDADVKTEGLDALRQWIEKILVQRN